MKRKNNSLLRKWNVLVAEDDLICRAELLKALIPISHCVTVGNGKEALTAYDKALKKKKPFDFLLLDITMPTVDGFEVLKSIREAEENSKIKNFKPLKIIMITAFKDSLMEHYNMGWDDFITKPVETDKLLNKMRDMSQDTA